MRRVNYFGPDTEGLATQRIDDRKHSSCALSRLVYLSPSSALEVDDFVPMKGVEPWIQGEQPRWVEGCLMSRIHVTSMTLRRAVIPCFVCLQAMVPHVAVQSTLPKSVKL